MEDYTIERRIQFVDRVYQYGGCATSIIWNLGRQNVSYSYIAKNSKLLDRLDPSTNKSKCSFCGRNDFQWRAHFHMGGFVNQKKLPHLGLEN